MSLDTKELPIAQATALLDRFGGRTKYAASALACIQAGQQVKQVYDRRKTSKSFTVTIPGADNVYTDLHEWALTQIPDDEQRSLMLDTHRKAPFARLRYDGSRAQRVNVDGHKVWLAVAQDGTGGDGQDSMPDRLRRFQERIIFTCDTSEARDAVVEMIEKLAASKVESDERPPLFLPSRWGGEWTQRDDMKPRTLESVILKDGQLERLTADLSTFLDSEEDYARLFQPWHRGYLFHGAPGTGKTSIARAIAHHFQMPVYYLPLGDVEQDANLISLVQQIRQQCMLLIEDVDVYSSAQERGGEEGDKKRASLSAVLNTLDGLWTPHGLVTVLTTNNIDALDEAVIRAGRVDLKEEFTTLDLDQAKRLGSYAGSSLTASKWVGKSPAEYLEAVRELRVRSTTRSHDEIAEDVAARVSGNAPRVGRARALKVSV